MMPIIQVGNGTPVIGPVENTVTFPALLSISWWQVAVAVWLAGMIVFLAYHVVKHSRFIKMAGRWSENITNEKTLALLESQKTEMGISKQIKSPKA